MLARSRKRISSLLSRGKLSTRQKARRLRYLSVRKRLIVSTASNRYRLLLSTHPHNSNAGVRALDILTLFADTWGHPCLGHKEIRVGTVILNRTFEIGLSRISKSAKIKSTPI